MLHWRNKKFLILISGTIILFFLFALFKSHNQIEAQGNWRQDFIQCAINRLEKPYRHGATGRDRFDCSGLVFYCYRQATDKAMPYRPGCSQLRGGASQIACNSTWVASANTSFAGIQPGDVVVRSPGYVNSNDGKRRRWGHIGIYVGDFQGRKNVVIHAGRGCPSGGSCVNSNSNLSKGWMQAYRLPEPRGGVTEVAYPLLSPQDFKYNAAPMPEIDFGIIPEEYYHPIIPQRFYDWLSYLLSMLLMLGGIIATLAIVISGVQYIVSGGNPALKNDAKNRLQNAIVGLIVLFSFYIILNTIDSELLDFTPRRPEPSPPQPAPVQVANANKIHSFAMAGGNQSRNPTSNQVSNIAQPTIEYRVNLSKISPKIPILIADVNNDSKNELAIFSQASSATVKFISEETRGLDDEKELSNPRVNPWGPFSLNREISDSPVILDIDGDGRSEILAVTKNNSLACWTIDYKQTKDIVNSVIDVSLDWEFCLSTGFLATTTDQEGSCPPSPAIGAIGPFVADIDNNGLPETIIVATKQDSPTGAGADEMDKTFGGSVYALVLQDIKNVSEELREIYPEPKPIVLWKGFDGFVNESGREKMNIEQGWFTLANLDDDYQNEIIFISKGTSKECAWPHAAIPQESNDCYYGQELKNDECILTLNCQTEREYENPTQISVFDGLTGIPMKIRGLPNGSPTAMPISFKFTNKVQNNVAIAWQDKEDNLPTIIIFEQLTKSKRDKLGLEENTLVPSWVYKLKEIKNEDGIQIGLVEKDQNGDMEKIIGLAAADLDNDMNDELVVSTSLGKVFALKWNKNGNIEETENFLPITNEISNKIEGGVELFWKWQEICNEDERGNPVPCKTLISPPTLADLDGDALKEVVIGSRSGKIHLLDNQGVESSKPSTDSLPSGCNCQGWKTNNICGESKCQNDHILYKRTCTPAGCAPQEQCVISSQCNKSIWELDLKKDLSSPFSHPIIDTDSDGRAEIVIVGKNRGEGNDGQLFVLGKLDSVKLELTDLSLANLILFEEHIKSIVIDKPINDMIAMSETCSCRDHCDPNRSVSGDYKPCCPELPCFKLRDNWCVNPGYPAKVNMPDKNPNYCPFTTSQNKTCDVKTDAESINPSVAPINRELRKLLGQGDVTTTTKTGYNYHGRPRLRLEEIKTGDGLPKQEDIQYQELVRLVEKIFKEFLDLCANPSNPTSSCASAEDQQTCQDACFVKRHFDTTRGTHNYCEDPETQRFIEKVRAAIKAELIKRNYLFEEGNENLYITNLNKVRDDLFKMNLKVASCKKDTNRLIGGDQTNSLVHCYDIVHQNTKKWETRLGFAERLKVPPESKTYPLSPLNLNEPFFCNVPTVSDEEKIILNPEEQEEKEEKLGGGPHYCAWDDFYCVGTADKAIASPDSWLYSTPQCYSLLKIEQEVLSNVNIECVHEITTHGWGPWKRRYSKINYFKITPQTEKKEIHFSFLEEAFQTIKRTYQLTTELYNKLLKASCWKECDQWCLYIFECTHPHFPIPIRMGPDLCCATDLESKDIEYLALDALLNLYPQRIKWPCNKDGNNDWPYPLILAEGRWVKELLGGLYDAWKETKCKIQDEYCDQCKHYYIKYEPREMTSDELAKEDTCNICQRAGMEGLPYCEAPCCRGVIEKLPDKTSITTYSSPQFCQKIVDLVQWFKSPPITLSPKISCAKTYVEDYITNILPSELNFDEALKQALDPRTQLANFTRELSDLRSLTPEEFYNQLKSELESMTDEEIEKYIEKELEKIEIKKSDAENTIKDIKAQLETIKNADPEKLLNKELTRLSSIDPNKFKEEKIEEISGFIELQEQKIIQLKIEIDAYLGIQMPEKIETTTKELEKIRREIERRSEKLTEACQQIPIQIQNTQNAITELKNKTQQGDLDAIKNQISDTVGKITNLESKIDICLQGNAPSDLKTMLISLKNTLGSFKSLITTVQKKLEETLDIQTKLEDWIREKTRIEELGAIRVLQEEQEEIERLQKMSPDEFVEELIEKLGMKEELAKLKWVFAELEKIQIESLSPDDFIASLLVELEREGVTPRDIYQEKIKELEGIIGTLQRKIKRINQIIDLLEKFTKEGGKKTEDLKKEFWQQIENLEKKIDLPPDLLSKIKGIEGEIGSIINEIENLKRELKNLRAESLSDKLELEITEKIAELQEMLDFIPGEIEIILNMTGILEGGLADITGGPGDLIGQIGIIGAIQNLQLLQEIQKMADKITSQLEIVENVGGIGVNELITRLNEVIEILEEIQNALKKVQELQNLYLGEISKILEDLSIPFLQNLEEIEGLKELRALLEIAELFEEDILGELQEEVQKVMGWQFPGGIIIEEFPGHSRLGTQICFAYEKHSALALALPGVDLGIPSLKIPGTCGSIISPKIGKIGPAELSLLAAINPETLEIDMDLISRIIYVLPKKEALKLFDEYHLLDCIKTEAEGTAPSWIGSFCGSAEDIYVSRMIDEMPRGQKTKQQCDMMDIYFSEVDVQKLQEYYLAKEDYGGILWQKMRKRNSFYKIIQDIIEEVQTRDVQDYLQYWQYVEAVNQTKRMVDDLGKENLILLLITSGL